MAKYNVNTIANWFIRRNNTQNKMSEYENLSLLKLLKLLYYAEGCSLAANNVSLFDDPILAWQYGPVVLSIYDKYKSNNRKLPLDLSSKEKISKDDDALLEQVYQTFGKYTAWALVDKTHKEKPWLEATENGSIYGNEISRESISNYFRANYIE